MSPGSALPWCRGRRRSCSCRTTRRRSGAPARRFRRKSPKGGGVRDAHRGRDLRLALHHVERPCWSVRRYLVALAPALPAARLEDRAALAPPAGRVEREGPGGRRRTAGLGRALLRAALAVVYGEGDAAGGAVDIRRGKRALDRSPRGHVGLEGVAHDHTQPSAQLRRVVDQRDDARMAGRVVFRLLPSKICRTNTSSPAATRMGRPTAARVCSGCPAAPH
jgi:hypothetical protein